MPEEADEANNAEARTFISRWEKSAAAEQANHQTFLSELTVLLSVPVSDPSVQHDGDNAYVFDRTIHFNDGAGHSTPGFIDLYRRDRFILEAKRGSDRPADRTALP